MNNIKMNCEIIEKSIEHWGAEAQTRQAMEECAELIQASNKQLRGKGDGDHLAEEIADVAICLEMLMLIWDISQEQVQQWVDKKQARLAERMEEDE